MGTDVPQVEPRRVELVEESLCARILTVAAGWQTAQYALVCLVAELDEFGGWEPDAPTCAHWVADALDVEVCTAREWIRVGRALRALPEIGAAFEAGLSYAKVRALTRVATPDNERHLLALAWDIPAGRLGPVLAKWLVDREAPAETEARQRRARAVWWRTEPDGMITGGFRLPTHPGRKLMAAIDTQINRKDRRRRHRDRWDASADASQGRWPSVAQQRADALVELLTGDAGTRFVTELVVHLRGDGATYDDGAPIPWADLERIMPEAFIRALIHDASGRPVNASSRRRHPTVRQQRVVAARQPACVDCGSTEFLEYDHQPAYERSHRTVVDELVHRCRTCHRAQHERADLDGEEQT